MLLGAFAPRSTRRVSPTIAEPKQRVFCSAARNHSGQWLNKIWRYLNVVQHHNTFRSNYEVRELIVAYLGLPPSRICTCGAPPQHLLLALVGRQRRCRFERGARFVVTAELLQEIAAYGRQQMIAPEHRLFGKLVDDSKARRGTFRHAD